MSKRSSKLHFRIPMYKTPPDKWRKRIHASALEASLRKSIGYRREDQLEIAVVLYFNKLGLKFHDVDNRAKDVLDALQGRTRGPKSKKRHKPIIPNDSQIFKLVVAKKFPPKQSHGAGHVTISKLKKE